MGRVEWVGGWGRWGWKDREGKGKEGHVIACGALLSPLPMLL